MPVWQTTHLSHWSAFDFTRIIKKSNKFLSSWFTFGLLSINFSFIDVLWQEQLNRLIIHLNQHILLEHLSFSWIGFGCWAYPQTSITIVKRDWVRDPRAWEISTARFVIHNQCCHAIDLMRRAHHCITSTDILKDIRPWENPERWLHGHWRTSLHENMDAELQVYLENCEMSEAQIQALMQEGYLSLEDFVNIQ